MRNQIRIRLDNKAEFCGGSEKKLKEWNEMLSFFRNRAKSYSIKIKAPDGYH